MHELSLAGGILQVVEDAAAREAFARVLQLRLEVGKLAGVELQALRFALEAIAPGTLLEGAEVLIDEPPGRAWCMGCSTAVEIGQRGDACPACAEAGERKARTVRVPVPAEVTDALKEIGAPGGYYFGHGGGKVETRTGDWRRQLRPLFAAANVPEGHAHRFRDTRAVELLNDGVPMDRVAAILGNTEEVCRKHYAPWVKERQDQLEADVRRNIQKRRKVVPMKRVG